MSCRRRSPILALLGLVPGLLVAGWSPPAVSAQDHAGAKTGQNTGGPVVEQLVVDGRLRAARTVGDGWQRDGGRLVGSQTGRLLVSDKGLGAGDFAVRARLSLARIDGSAASLQFGSSSHFGLDSRSGTLFVEGPLFGSADRMDPTAEHITPGETFELLAVRDQGVLELRIDGALVFRVAVGDGEVGPVGLRPWRNTMAIESFEIRGHLVEPTPSLFERDDVGIVFRGGEGGYHTYRIPAVVSTAKGTLLAFCEGRKQGRGDAGDIDLLLRRSTDGGATWGPMQVIWNDGGNTCGNPAPVVDRRTGRVLLLSTWNRGDDHERDIIAGKSEDTRRVFVLHSDDDGRTWTEAREITASTKRDDWTWYATGPCNGIQLSAKSEHDGRLVVPCDHIERDTRKYWSHCIYSDDGGATWQLGESTPRDQVNECTVAELSDGRLLLNMRNYDRSQKLRQVAISADGGHSWTDQRHDEALIEPICQASLLRWELPKGHGEQRGEPALLFSNPASQQGRVKLMVRLSTDDGRTWPRQAVLHPGPTAYSCLVALPDGGAACLFEAGDRHSYEAIAWRRVPFDGPAPQQRR